MLTIRCSALKRTLVQPTLMQQPPLLLRTQKHQVLVSRSKHSKTVKRAGLRRVLPQVSTANASEFEEEDIESLSTVGAQLLADILPVEKNPYMSMLNNMDDAFDIKRAPSSADANVLRRKGHLKEQDLLIEFMLKMHPTHSPHEVMVKMERWIREHRQSPRGSSLKRLVPTIGKFYTTLKLVEALEEYDSFSIISQRKYVPPNFAEFRHILNIAQVHASAENLRLMTFDADGTLYEDGSHFLQDNQMIKHLVALLRNNVHVAIVTAAGYPGEPEKFEQRLAGLLRKFKEIQLPPELCARFHVMGGECNYLLKLTDDWRLKFEPNEDWMLPEMLEWDEEEVQHFLDDVEQLLVQTCTRLQIPVQVIRKTRAVGVVPKQQTIYEALEEIALTVQEQIETDLPFCAFNGGGDVFVDVGNKRLGLTALQKYLGNCHGSETLHVGDRFTVSGNDAATRATCSIIWVANPDETAFFTQILLEDIRRRKLTPYIE